MALAERAGTGGAAAAGGAGGLPRIGNAGAGTGGPLGAGSLEDRTVGTVASNRQEPKLVPAGRAPPALTSAKKDPPSGKRALLVPGMSAAALTERTGTSKAHISAIQGQPRQE